MEHGTDQVAAGAVDGAAHDSAPRPARSEASYEPTGVAEVDGVLADVAAMTSAPVADHVEVFEKAHERLRRALDAPAPGDDQAS